MDLNTFITQAIRTESRIETVQANKELLEIALINYIIAGTLLDQIKKNVFYNKPFNTQKVEEKIKITDPSLMNDPGFSYDHIEQMMNEKETINIDPRVFHALVGIMTESTELAEQLLKGVRGESMDRTNLLEEGGGDIGWYQAILMDALGADWGEVLQTVINKLRARYPEKFTNENAINRDLNKEREILEKGM